MPYLCGLWRFANAYLEYLSERRISMAIKKKNSASVEMIAYKFYGVPSARDLQLELQTYGCCRKLWNLMLSDKNDYYQEHKQSLQVTPAYYKKDYPFLKDVDSLALCNVQMHQDSAFSSFFKGTTRYPVFKSKKNSRKTYTTNAIYSKRKDGTSICNINLDETTGELQLPKHKDPIQLKLHRSIKPNGKLKSVTVSMNPDGKCYYSILMEYPKQVHVAKIDPANNIGLDMSLPKLYVDSNGDSPDFPKPYRTVESRIAKIQRCMSHKKHGSANYEKERKRLAKLYAKSKHQRSDMLHKLSCKLTDQYDVIGIENLDMSAMKKALRFGKSVSDNGWGMFVNMLQYKADQKEKKLIKIDRWFPSSKTCCACGHVHKKLTLSDRTYICPVCGHVMDRDKQAAINIKNEAIRMLG